MRSGLLRRSALAAAAAALLVTAACGSGSSAVEEGQPLVLEDETVASAELLDAARAEGSLVLYTAHNEVTTQAMKDRFEEETGISVEVIRTPAGRLFERIKSEKGAGNLPADVVIMGDASLTQDLAASGVFTPYTVAADDRVDPRYQTPDDRYYIAAGLATVLAYNTETYQGTPPSSWAQVPDLAGTPNRFGMVHATAGGAGGWGLALFMRQNLAGGGTDYWRRIAALNPLLDTSVGSLAEKLGRGEIALAAARPPEVAALKEQGAPVELVWPTDGVPLIPLYLGGTGTGAHPNAAKVFENWMLSKHGQTVLAENGGDYAVRSDAPGPKLGDTAAPPLSELQAAFAPDDVWTGNRESWLKDWSGVFGQ